MPDGSSAVLSSAKNAAMDRQRCSPLLTTFGSSTHRARKNKLVIKNAVRAALLASIKPKRAPFQHLTQKKLFNGLYPW